MTNYSIQEWERESAASLLNAQERRRESGTDPWKLAIWVVFLSVLTLFWLGMGWLLWAVM